MSPILKNPNTVKTATSSFLSPHHFFSNGEGDSRKRRGLRDRAQKDSKVLA